MKKLIIYTLIMLVFGGIVNLAVQTTVKKADETQHLNAACQLLGPGMLFAGDTLVGDTLGDGGQPKPPPID